LRSGRSDVETQLNLFYRPCTVGGSTRTTAAEWLRTVRFSVGEQIWLADSH
jgi:hypothetical protein